MFSFLYIAVQIFFVEERQHWITTAMINGEVYLFDCLFNGTLTPSAELQIAQLYKPLIGLNGLLVSVVPIQQQQGTNNCGLFSIAAAYHAAVRSDIGLLTFNESRLRAHLIKCFEQKKLTRFPQSKKLCVTRPPSQNFVIVVYCPCKKPDSFQNMIQCDQCGVWFHYTCAKVVKPPDDDWFCSNCK